jgi:hypothetical protein
MSQSDYIQYRKTANRLKEVNKLAPVLSSQDYTLFKSYSLENSIVSQHTVYYKSFDETTRFVFDMPMNNVSECPVVEYCENTNTRANRVLNMWDGTKYTPQPLRPIALKTIKVNNPEKVDIRSHRNCQCIN